MPTDPFATVHGWSSAESIIRRFEDAWHGPNQPNMAEFLPAQGPLRTQLLIELAHIDLEFRLRHGESARVEEYVDRFPELAGRDRVLGLIVAEYGLRNRVGAGAFPEEYQLRFPELGNELTQVLSVGQTGDPQATRPGPRPLALFVGVPEVPGCEVEAAVGRGGMGVVYRARQPALNRLVAIKTLASPFSLDEQTRFRREAEAVARLDHPNIVAIFDVGQWTPPAGPAVPYFVMQWCPNGGLDTAPSGPGTPPREHARMLEIVARAVHHAHQRGVLHRDLKPANILLDAEGQPHVADFGLAGWYDPRDPRSMTAAIVGTPAYMAPEQAHAPSQVTSSADIYGLGAVLFHMLTGKPPFLADTPLATMEQAATQPAPLPSSLNPDVPRDLDVICLKCLEKEPARRYTSAEELADDLRRFLDHRPIRARRTPLWERYYRQFRRRPQAVALVSMTLIAVLTATIAIGIIAVQRDRQRAENAARIQREERALYLDSIAAANRLYLANQLPAAWQQLDRCPQEQRGWEWFFLDRMRHETPQILPGHTNLVTHSDFLADGRLAVGEANGIIRIWDVDQAIDQRRWGTFQPPLGAMSAHPSQPWLAVADASAVVVWNVDTGAIVKRLPGARSVAFSPDGEHIALADQHDAILYRVAGWEAPHRLMGHTDSVLTMTFDPQSSRLYTGSLDRTIRQWDVATAKPIGTPWKRPVPPQDIRATADGKEILCVDPLQVAMLDAHTGAQRGRNITSDDPGARAAIGPDSRWVAITAAGDEVHLWDRNHARDWRRLRGFDGRLLGLRIRPDGSRLAAYGSDSAVRVWDLTRQPECDEIVRIGMRGAGLTIAPNGELLAVGLRPSGVPEEEVIRLFGLDGRELARVPGLWSAAFLPDSQGVAVHRRDGTVAIHDTNGAQRWATPGERNHATVIAVSPDGSLVASASRRIRILRSGDGRVMDEFEFRDRGTYAMAFQRDGSRLALGGPLSVKVWNLNRREFEAWSHPARGALALAFHPREPILATADRDRVVRIRAAATGDVQAELAGSPAEINAIAFNSTGDRLVTGSADGTLRIWDVASGRELLELGGGHGPVSAVVWHADDRIFSLDDSVRVWKARAR